MNIRGWLAKIAQIEADELERTRLEEVRKRTEAEDKAYLERLAEQRDLKDRLDSENDEKELDRIRCRRCGEAPWSCVCSNPGAENY